MGTKTKTATKNEHEPESRTATLLRQSIAMVDADELAAVLRLWSFEVFARGVQGAVTQGVPEVLATALVDGFDEARCFGIEAIRALDAEQLEGAQLERYADALETIGEFMRREGANTDAE
jgi:ribosome biogenesis protein Nip4